jgi:hypothetical protein
MSDFSIVGALLDIGSDRDYSAAEHARAVAPTRCASCGEVVPTRSTFMTAKGLTCGICFEKSSGPL